MYIKNQKKRYIFPERVVNNTLYLLITLLLFNPVQAQHTAGNPVPQKTLHLNGRYSLSQLTADAYKQTGIGFSFDAKKIKDQRPLVFANKNYTLQQVLLYIQHTTGLQYAVYTGHIILHNAPAAARRQKPLKPVPVIIARKKDSPSLPPFVPLPPEYAQAVLPEPFHNPLPSGPAGLHARLSALPAAKVPVPLKTAPPPAPAGTPEPEERTLSKLHLQAGVFATDAMYTNAGIEAGASWLHLLASVGANPWTREWRLGLGTLVKRTTQSDFQINATIGFMQKAYEADSSIYPRTITVKGVLPALQLEWRYFFSSRLCGKLAMGYNILFTTYYVNGQKRGLPQDRWENGDETFRLVSPFKLLSNNYAPEKPNNIKQWIGGSVGIYYNLHFFR